MPSCTQKGKLAINLEEREVKEVKDDFASRFSLV
jgi:hypothetical protein